MTDSDNSGNKDGQTGQDNNSNPTVKSPSSIALESRLPGPGYSGSGKLGVKLLRYSILTGLVAIGFVAGVASEVYHGVSDYLSLSSGNKTEIAAPAQESDLESTTNEMTDVKDVSSHTYQAPVTESSAQSSYKLPSTDDLVMGYYESTFANKNMVLGENDEHTLNALANEFLEGFDVYFMAKHGYTPGMELGNEVHKLTKHILVSNVEEQGYTLKDNQIRDLNGQETKEVLVSLE
ncbi:hypothetical protein HOC35_04995 [Candidatus Woesearchaeota archaeon]|jgi:hypothetical protein|nr:hypothetical protein [Candidatus Woesearchaeota archaeon]